MRLASAIYIGTAATSLVAGISSHAWADAAGGAHCGLEDPAAARRAPPVPEKARASREEFEMPAVRRVRPGHGAPRLQGTVGHGAAGGALAGKTVYVSPGHGFVWSDEGWRTQRFNTNDIVEDLVSVESVSQYLIPYLRNMGAYVVPVRETDLNSNLAVVDDGDESFTVDGELDIQPGPAGFGHVPAPVSGQENPFQAGGSHVFTASESETGRAVWTFDVPEDGEYNVYIGYVQDPSRASDARYIVRHGGADTEFRVDQRRHGSTWVLLGRFYFRADSPPERRQVVLANDSSEPGATISADVARIGGGPSVLDRGGGPVDRPMYESAARYYTQLAGAPPAVYAAFDDDQSADVACRSRFADWEHEAGEDAVYISWHTNAPDPGRGTSSYAYAPVPPNGSLDQFTGVPGSLELMDAIHTEIVSDLRNAWDASWPDAGQHTAFFGEVNPDHNDEMPSVLFEIAFHDTPADAEALRDPRFRQIAARAMAQGVARYFADRDGRDLVLPPEPPVTVRARADGPGAIHLAWDPAPVGEAGGDAATSYRVYLSRDGRAFDNGHPVSEAEATLDVPWSGPVYARVTAVNDGGESLPSPVVGTLPSGEAPVLVVDGFTRIDRFMAVPEDLSAYGLSVVDRVFLNRMNDRSYAARHGQALAAAGIPFESTSAAAVAAGDVDLGDYRAVSWFLGEESSGQDPLGAEERAAIGAYLGGGGKLFVSGAEIGWALVEQGDPESAAFYEEVLGASYVEDDAETYRVDGVGALADLGDIGFGDRGPGGFDADFPDVIAPGADGEEVLVYQGGKEGAAGVLSGDPDGGQVLLFGFPFETVEGEDARAELMRLSMGALGLEPEDEGGGSGPDAGPGGGGSGRTDRDDTAAGGCQIGAGGAGSLAAPLVFAAAAARLRRRRGALRDARYRA